MNATWGIDAFLTISTFIVLAVALFFLLKIDWRKYGLLYLLSMAAGVALCYLFVYLGLYTFPYLLFPAVAKIPFTLIITIFPLFVLFGVRFSPKGIVWKIAFYWVLVHLGVLGEVLAETRTQLLHYGTHWMVWESYTWWWIYLLVFEWVGGMIVPQSLRKPISREWLSYGHLGWFVVHAVLIATIFLAGVYAGQVLMK